MTEIRAPQHRRHQRSRPTLLRQYWGAIVVAASVAWMLLTGFIGLNFGVHWDEGLQLTLVNQSIRRGVLLPLGFYQYPSMAFDLTVLSLAGKVYARLGSNHVITPAEFYLRVRGVFLVVSSLGGIGVYFALRRWSGELGAAFGATVYLLSWELAYHARWIAPDAILASVTGLFLAVFTVAWCSDSTWKFYLPAGAAGVALSSKYQGAILIVPIFVLLIASARRNHWPTRTIVRKALFSALWTLILFFVITPGALFQPRTVTTDIRQMNAQYHASGGEYFGSHPYDVQSHLSFFGNLSRYLTLYLPSHYPLLSLVTMVLAGVGIYALAAKDRWFALALLAPCAILLVYFSTFDAFVVRNYLLFLPFMAVFAGAGAACLVRAIRAPPVQALFVGGLLVIVAINATWLWSAAESIAHRGVKSDVSDAVAYMQSHRDERFVVSAGVQRAFASERVPLPSNTTTGDKAQELMFFDSETQTGASDDPGRIKLAEWPSTQGDSYVTLGPEEVNFNYYSTWLGSDRIIVLPVGRASAFGLTPKALSVGP